MFTIGSTIYGQNITTATTGKYLHSTKEEQLALLAREAPRVWVG